MKLSRLRLKPVHLRTKHLPTRLRPALTSLLLVLLRTKPAHLSLKQELPSLLLVLLGMKLSGLRLMLRSYRLQPQLLRL